MNPFSKNRKQPLQTPNHSTPNCNAWWMCAPQTLLQLYHCVFSCIRQSPITTIPIWGSLSVTPPLLPTLLWGCRQSGFPWPSQGQHTTVGEALRVLFRHLALGGRGQRSCIGSSRSWGSKEEQHLAQTFDSIYLHTAFGVCRAGLGIYRVASYQMLHIILRPCNPWAEVKAPQCSTQPQISAAEHKLLF